MIAEHLGVEEWNVTMEASLACDLGADSLDLNEFGINLENEFEDAHLNFEWGDMEKFITVGDVVKYIANRYKTGPAVLWLAVSKQKRTNSTVKNKKIQRTR